jgi:hypothetical protein
MVARTPGLGDRWLAGERLEGVAFGVHDRVTVTEGVRAGSAGGILLLLAVAPEPVYLVALDAGAGDVRVRQSALRAAH